MNTLQKEKQSLSTTISNTEVVLCMIETSGKMKESILKDFASEVLRLKNSFINNPKEVILISADTVLRGQESEITDLNDYINSGYSLMGRGGKDLNGTLSLALNTKMLKNKNITSVICLTDLTGVGPSKLRYQPYLNKGITFTFVVQSNEETREFEKDVKDFAQVYALNENEQIDLTSLMAKPLSLKTKFK